jgi:ribosomal protein S6--L-glutamate ligase
MKIAILSLRSQSSGTQRLTEAALVAGHTVQVLDPFGCYLHIGGKGKSIYYNGVPAEDFDVVLPRLGKVTAQYGLEVVAHFEWLGVPVINRALPITNARHKFRSLRILAQHGLPVPPSFTAGSAQFLDCAVHQTGDYPFIMKPFEGSQGKAILLLDTPTALASAVNVLCNDLYHDYVIQPYMCGTDGKASVVSDIRVIVVGAKVIGGMRRIAQAGEFRANLHQGGRGERIDLPDLYSNIAIRATDVLGLDVAGVDVLETDDGPVILEVNPSPGMEVETVTGIPIAEAIIAFAAEYCQNHEAQVKSPI